MKQLSWATYQGTQKLARHVGEWPPQLAGKKGDTQVCPFAHQVVSESDFLCQVSQVFELLPLLVDMVVALRIRTGPPR